MGEDFHGLPKWVWIVGLVIVVLALLLARRSNATTVQPTVTSGGSAPIDANTAAENAAAISANASTNVAESQAKAGGFAALVAGVTSLLNTDSTNRAAVASNVVLSNANVQTARYAAGRDTNAEFFNAITEADAGANATEQTAITTGGAVAINGQNTASATAIAGQNAETARTVAGYNAATAAATAEAAYKTALDNNRTAVAINAANNQTAQKNAAKAAGAATTGAGLGLLGSIVAALAFL